MENNAQPVINIADVKNQFGAHIIHQDLNFSVNEKEIVAIIGSSGSGKTTLLRSILGLLKPTQGTIEIFGEPINLAGNKTLTAIRRRMGVVFQHSALFSSLSVLENILFPLRESTHLSHNLQETVAFLKLKLVGLNPDIAHLMPSELSGGMQRRVAFARAIALDPTLLLLDEPTTGLDPKSAEAIDDLILLLRETLGLTIVMISHDLDSLWRVTDSVAFLGDKKVIGYAPMAQLVQNPHPAIQGYFGGPRGQVRTHSTHSLIANQDDKEVA